MVKKMLEKHLRRMEEIAILLGLVTEDLKEICEELKAMAASAPPQAKQVEAEAKAEPTTGLVEAGPLTIEKVQDMFPEELLGKLYFEDAGDSIIVRPRSYLGDEFREVARIACESLEAYTSAPERTATSKSRRKKPRLNIPRFFSLKCL